MNPPQRKSQEPAKKKSAAKKIYEKPAFRLERVFEVMALACGKINTTQGSCRNNRKNS